MLEWLYVMLFAAEVFLLVWNLRRHKGLGVPLILNALPAALSLFLMWYFDTLPGYGIMPGLADFPEVFYSLCATAVFTVLTLVTFLCMLYHRKK